VPTTSRYVLLARTRLLAEWAHSAIDAYALVVTKEWVNQVVQVRQEIEQLATRLHLHLSYLEVSASSWKTTGSWISIAEQEDKLAETDDTPHSWYDVLTNTRIEHLPDALTDHGLLLVADPEHLIQTADVEEVDLEFLVLPTTGQDFWWTAQRQLDDHRLETAMVPASLLDTLEAILTTEESTTTDHGG